MGWTSYHATYYKSNGEVDRKKEVDNMWNTKTTQVVKSRMVGSVYYAAIKDLTFDNVFGVVTLTMGKDRNDPYFNFGYKDISEDMGPGDYDCPKSILDMLSPTNNEYALEWRKRCRERLTKPKLKDVPVGTKIKFTRYDGKEIVLEKMAPAYQFKRNWWLIVGENKYMSQKYIPDNWEIVKKGE